MIITLVCAICFSDQPFRIRVYDESTKRGVPLVELEAMTNQRFYTDSNGLAAITDPVLMNRTAFFYVRSHGYEFKKDGFGIAGARLEVKPGGRADLSIKRLNIAERLYRVTGGGIYRHTVALGEKPPIKQPLLNAQVLGSDSVQMTAFKGKLYWFWGDTNRPSYPLGNFQTPGATSLFPSKGGLDPEVGVDLDYFVAQDGFAKGTAPMPGEGPTWTVGLTVLQDAAGNERMFAGYMKVKNMLDVYERGLMEWDDKTNAFQKVIAFPKDVRAYPTGHSLRCLSKDGDHIYFSDAAPFVRVKADPKALMDSSAYEVFGCTVPKSDPKNPTVERESNGKPKYSWRSGRSILGHDGYANLVISGKLKPDEVASPFRDPDTGKRLIPHAGSTVWNAFRQKWIMVATEIMGTSMLGEIWYAEADSPAGPWVYARKILTHDKYSFYNPKWHPLFSNDIRAVYFEGTYTTMFSGNTNPTPDYEYNQIMHRMNLDDPRLNLPTPIYEVERLAPRFVTRRGLTSISKGRATFCALDRPGNGTLPVYVDPDGKMAIGVPPTRTTSFSVFHALPPTATKLPASTVALHERFDEKARRYVYSVRKGPPVEKDEKLGVRIMYVWENPKADEPAFRAEEVMSCQDPTTK